MWQSPAAALLKMREESIEEEEAVLLYPFPDTTDRDSAWFLATAGVAALAATLAVDNEASRFFTTALAMD